MGFIRALVGLYKVLHGARSGPIQVLKGIYAESFAGFQ